MRPCSSGGQLCVVPTASSVLACAHLCVDLRPQDGVQGAVHGQQWWAASALVHPSDARAPVPTRTRERPVAVRDGAQDLRDWALHSMLERQVHSMSDVAFDGGCRIRMFFCVLRPTVWCWMLEGTTKNLQMVLSLLRAL